MTEGFKEETLAGFVSPATPQYAAALKEWFDRSLHHEFCNQAPPTDRELLCLGMLAYRHYAQRFLNCSLPSLLAPGNLDALDDPFILIHTDEAGAAAMSAPLKQAGVKFELIVIPGEILAMVDDDPANKYWLLGATQQLHLQAAKFRRRGYHALFPDHVFAAGFFANLARLMPSHPAILHTNLSARIEKVMPALVARNFNLSPKQLNALALDHLHPHMAQFVMNGRAGFPAVHLLLLIGNHDVKIVCPHLSVGYLSHEVLTKLPVRLFNTLDADLAYMIPPDVPIYSPSRDDGLTVVELSGDRVVLPASECDAGEFAIRFWVLCHCNPAYERFFHLTTEMPLPDNYRSAYPVMSEEAIIGTIERTRRDIRESRAIANMILPLVAQAFERGKLWGPQQVKEAELAGVK